MLLIFFIVAIFIFLFVFQKWFNNIGRNNPSGPRGLPFIGNLHQLDKSVPLYHQFWQLSQKYGPLVYLQLGFVPTLVVSSAKMAKEILKTHDLAFSDRPNLVGLRKITYNCKDFGFAPYNEYSKELKKICIIQFFSPKKVKSFRPATEEEIKVMIDKIENFANVSKAIDLSEMVMSLTSTIICRIAFGKGYSKDAFARNKFCELLSEGQAAYGGFYISDYFPCTGWIDILAGNIALRDKTFKELDAFVEKIIFEHMDDERDIKPGQEDIVDVLLKIQKDGSSRIKLTLDGIKAFVLLDIFIAGTDTSSSVLVWAMTELVKNPKSMERLQKEIRDLNQNKKILNEDDIQNIPYLQAVLKETMRLHPPVPLLLPHKATEICNLNGYIIRPKTLVHINMWAIGRDPESWDDPEEFLPERFLGRNIDFRGQEFELIPFGAGKRSCPGMPMAIATIELGLANIMYLFNWNLPSGMNEDEIDMNVKPGITMHKKVPLCLIPDRYF